MHTVVELNAPGLTGYQWVNFAVTFSYLGPQKEEHKVGRTYFTVEPCKKFEACIFAII